MVSIDSTAFMGKSNDLRPSVTARVLNSYLDMQTTTRQFIAEKPSEGRLLLVLMLSNLFFVLSWSIKALITPTASAAEMMGADVTLWIVMAMMLRITAIYAMALVIGVVCKALGGNATMQETRAGVFWGAFVAAPIGLAIAGLASLIASLDQALPFLQYESIQMMPYWLGLVPFIWFVAKGAASANRLNNTIPLFGAMAAACVAMGFGINLMSAGVV